MGTKPKKLKTHIPRSPEEWLEYTEHRERWTPEMRIVIDQRIKDTFPLAPEDAERIKRIKKDSCSALH